MSQNNPERLTKSERREQARIKAREAREAQIKQERKKRLMLQGGIVLGVLAIVAVIALVVVQAIKPAGPGPENMASGGIVFEGEDFTVRETPAIEPGEQLVAQKVNRDEAPLDVVVYVDYLCPYCGIFEQEAGPMLEQWVGSGQATLQIYPLTLQDNFSKGSRYSTRAANAVACVAEQQPEHAWKFHASLLSEGVQPQQNTSGLSNDQLVELAGIAGADETTSLKSCINTVPFADFFTNTTRQALSGPLIGLADGALMSDGGEGFQDPEEPQHLTGTPAVVVNGHQAPIDVNRLEQYMLTKFTELTDATEEIEESEETEISLEEPADESIEEPKTDDKDAEEKE